MMTSSPPPVQSPDLSRAAELLRNGSALVLTGAGISVDSGIPDFRSPGGLWERYRVEEYATLAAFLARPEKVWRFFHELSRLVKNTRPNAGHLALARLEKAGRVAGVVTQNVDGLHQLAGSRQVIEIHGSGARLACIACGAVAETSVAEEARARPGDQVPRCACGHPLKPDVVLFGENLPPHAFENAMAAAGRASVCLVCGTSAEVYPAAMIPRWALEQGIPLIEVNLEPTELTDWPGTIYLRGSTSAVLPALADLAGA